MIPTQMVLLERWQGRSLRSQGRQMALLLYYNKRLTIMFCLVSDTKFILLDTKIYLEKDSLLEKVHFVIIYSVLLLIQTKNNRSQWEPRMFSYKHSSKYLLLSSTEERKSYRFGTTQGWVNDRILHFWVNYNTWLFIILWKRIIHITSMR